MRAGVVFGRRESEQTQGVSNRVQKCRQWKISGAGRPGTARLPAQCVLQQRVRAVAVADEGGYKSVVRHVSIRSKSGEE
jgi:hypothetical protein